EVTLLLHGHTAADQELSPSRHEAIRPQMRITLEMPTPGESRLQRRLQHGHRVAVVATGRHVEDRSQKVLRLCAVFHRGFRAKNEEQTARLPFAIKSFDAHQLVIEAS